VLINFPKQALGYTKSPLGIIALFIVLVYGIAAFAFSQGGGMDDVNITPLIYFLVFFPILVFCGFVWLVANHHTKLYGPSDYKNEELFLKSQLSSAFSLAVADFQHESDGNIKPQLNLDELLETVTNNTNKNKDWRARVLWVDDRPENNVYERKAFEAQGVDFSIALSTKSALEQLENNKFAVVISDMGRKEGPKEGYVLLDEMQKRAIDTPFVIYAGSNSAEHKKLARERGAIGSTSRPDELFTLVMNALTLPK
jgi:CheY-like chemotaxis protein